MSPAPADRASAYANNDVAFIAWTHGAKLTGCLGFAVYRVDVATNQKAPLPAWVGFRGESNKQWQPKTTEIWPLQKFNWCDFTAPRGGTYKYEIVPMTGAPGGLHPVPAQRLTTNAVRLTPKVGKVSAYFNRGILSTQALARAVPAGPSGVPNYQVLKDRIDQPGDPLRNSLAGQLIDGLADLLSRAKTQGGAVYCALYELNDPELLELLLGAPFVHVVLSNTGADDATNIAARQALHESSTDVSDRMLAGGHIGHNKFAVYVDGAGAPQAVLTGSTNWTYTALCGQSNNALVIESPVLAKEYYDYWGRLKADGAAQAPTFRTQNNAVRAATVDGSDVRLWFSPNTKAKTKPSKNAAAPSDMAEVFTAITGAQQAVLFLLFQPGSPSVFDAVLAAQQANPRLFVRGAATDAKAVGKYNTDLYHRPGDRRVTVVAAAAITDQFAFWQKELLKSSPSAHAIIHDKIVVIDPRSPNCVVITGSHNLGYRASYNNDENMLIIRGNQPLAAAYAVHVMDVYDHYRFRYTVQSKKAGAWSGLVRDDRWQDKYFRSPSIKSELEFWA